ALSGRRPPRAHGPSDHRRRLEHLHSSRRSLQAGGEPTTRNLPARPAIRTGPAMNGRISRRPSAAFTLPVVLVAMAAMLTLAIGLLAVMRIERATAVSHSDAKRAELAVQAGLASMIALLRAETA